MKGKIKEARLRLKMTQVEVAARVGVSMNAYILWEREVSNPNPENMAKLKKVLKLDGQA